MVCKLCAQNPTEATENETPLDKFPDLLDVDKLRRSILQGLTLIGFFAFLSATFLNRPGGLEGAINGIMFPTLAAMSLFYCLALAAYPKTVQLISVIAYLSYDAYMVGQLYLILFLFGHGLDVRVAVYPLVPWIPMMYVFAFAMFDRGLAVRLSAIYYFALLAVGGTFLFFHPEIEPGTKNAIIQQLLFANAAYVCMLLALGSVKERFFQARIAAVRLERLAFTDELTGMPNRRALLKILQTELARLKRHKIVFSVMVLDFDYFKRINDVYGHASGDLVLKGSARVISTILRETDWCGRWGGEEFVVVLSGSPLAGAAIFAERLRAALANHNFGKLPPVTASFGATEATDTDDILSLFKRADQALYQAKEKGRNCVVAITALGDHLAPPA